MRSGWFPVVPWASGIVVLSLVGLLVFRLELLPFLLMFGAGLSALTWGAVTVLLCLKRPRPFTEEDPRVVVGSSWAVVVVCVGLAVGFGGLLAFGMAFAFVGLVLVAAGLAGLLREQRAERHLVRRARERLT